MSTRGAFGFAINGEEKIGYNHMDSYPDGKGVEVLQFLRGYTEQDAIDVLRAKVENLKVVSEKKPATPEQILELRPYSNFYVNVYSMAGPPGGVLPTEDVPWYNLLRETQGELDLILAAGYLEDGSSFPLSSLFCEWAYIIDLDAGLFEAYRGFQKRLPKAGRWKGRPTKAEDIENYKEHLYWCAKNGRDPWQKERSEYKAVELATSWPFDSLPSDEEFLGYFRLMSARDTLVEYPDDVEEIAYEIDEEDLAGKGKIYAAEWAKVRADVDKLLTGKHPGE